MLTKLKNAYISSIWEQDLDRLSPWRRRLIWTARVIVAIVRDFWFEGKTALHTTDLVYTSLLSIIPLLAFSFSILKAFGVQKRFEPLLYGFLAPLGPHGIQLGHRIVAFVNNVKVGVLGSVGLLFLLYYIFMLAQKVEWGLNDVWRVKRGRSLAVQFSHYLTVILIGPFLMVAVFGVTTLIGSQAVGNDILAIEPFGWLVLAMAKVGPYAIIIAAFTFIYSFVPNTRVRFRSALVGGVYAGILWVVAGLIYASTTASSTSYHAIYSGFAIAILFLIWLYLCWLILLVGGEIAFYHQNPYFLHRRRTEAVADNRLRERMALLVMFLVAKRFHSQQQPWSFDELECQLHVPGGAFGDVIEELEGQGLLTLTAPPNQGYVPGSALDRISLRDIVEAVRGRHESYATAFHGMTVVDSVVNDYDAFIDKQLKGRTLHDLVVDAKKLSPDTTSEAL
jgi:membrane protein